MPRTSSQSDRLDSPVELSDADLIASTRAGDVAAFDALVRRHYRAAFAVALANAGNRADAEDACHDAFVRAAVRLDDCREPHRFAQWLCAIARNQARNLVARAKVRRASPLAHETAASPENTERASLRAELRRRLEAGLAVLSPIQREVVLLHDLDGWSHEAIADAIDTSAGMSRQHLFHARQRLREFLGADLLKEYFDEG